MASSAPFFCRRPLSLLIWNFTTPKAGGVLTDARESSTLLTYTLYFVLMILTVPQSVIQFQIKNNYKRAFLHIKVKHSRWDGTRNPGPGGSWVAQLVKWPTSVQVRISQFVSWSPGSGGLCADCSEPGACFGFCVSLSL